MPGGPRGARPTRIVAPTGASCLEEDVMDKRFGGRAIEVAAVFGDSIVGVRHLVGPSRSVRIGRAAGVDFPTAEMEDLPLVVPTGDGFVVNVGQGMDGEMTVGGRSAG